MKKLPRHRTHGVLIFYMPMLKGVSIKFISFWKSVRRSLCNEIESRTNGRIYVTISATKGGGALLVIQLEFQADF